MESVLFSVGEHIRCENIDLKRDVFSTTSFYVFIKANAGSFQAVDEGKSFMIYASTAGLKCFECGDIGHRQFACPHKAQVNTEKDNVDKVVHDVNEQVGEKTKFERTETVTE